MDTNIENKFKVVTPSEGMWLYNGDSFSDKLIAPLSADLSDWYEVTDEDKARIEEERLAEEAQVEE